MTLTHNNAVKHYFRSVPDTDHATFTLLPYKDRILGQIQHQKGTTSHLNEDLRVAESGKDIGRLLPQKGDTVNRFAQSQHQYALSLC